MSEAEGDFQVAFPANARLDRLHFEPGRLVVRFADDERESPVQPSQLRAIHGASILRESTLPDLGASTSLMTKMFGQEPVEVSEATQYALALRTASPEVWYLVADTFNFRESLGADAGLMLHPNFVTLVRRLISFAPQAVQDAFVTAVAGSLPLPPPVGSLMEFLRVAAR